MAMALPHIFDSFTRAMLEAGLAPHASCWIPEADGVLHRYRVEGDKSGSLNGWYVLRNEDPASGAFGSWKTGYARAWTIADTSKISPAERRALQRRMAETKALRDAEQAKVHADAMARAEKLWARAIPASSSHPYLMRKAVPAYGIRLLRQQLVIPLRDSTGRLHSLQFISPDGSKKLLTGGMKRGCYHAIGRPNGALCIGEGYATCATVHRCTGHATAVAFDAGNLLPVAQAIRRKFPDLALVMLADNDTETPGNPGLKHANAAAKAVGAALAVPVFP